MNDKFKTLGLATLFAGSSALANDLNVTVDLESIPSQDVTRIETLIRKTFEGT